MENEKDVAAEAANQEQAAESTEDQGFDLMSNLNIDEDVETNEEGGGIMGVGIHHPVVLEEIKIVHPDSEDAKWEWGLDFGFKNTKTGEIKSKRCFLSSDMTKEKFENFVKKVKHILNKFIPNEEISIKGAKSFDELGEAIIALVPKENFGTVVGALKVIADAKSEYGNIPDYTPFFVHEDNQESLNLSAKEREGLSATDVNDLPDQEEVDLPDLP